ncbi:MAG: hypothetical protein IJY74_03275 [Oscillospiraceae bacterium]|nr:hypothetical protein [Oscillospiraceae bacterium]
MTADGNYSVKSTSFIDWIGYRIALMADGAEVPYTSITYNISVSGLVFDEDE